MTDIEKQIDNHIAKGFQAPKKWKTIIEKFGSRFERVGACLSLIETAKKEGSNPEELKSYALLELVHLHDAVVGLDENIHRAFDYLESCDDSPDLTVN
ncbi:MAG: hypothetical protein KAG66_24005 [Methylococcales bacterium]|nr:hypothetical protein [Methylococcales bacterium]